MNGELAALLALLDDDNERVAEAVATRLAELGEAAREGLREVARDGNPRQRARAREIEVGLERVAALARLAEFAREPIRDLEEGAILLAALAFPGTDAAALRRRLDELASDLAPAVRGAWPGEGRLRAFLKGFHGTRGFGGDRRDYESLANDFLPGVLERRRGIPITIALLHVLVGRRLDLDFGILGLPGHAISRFRERRFTGYVDGFDGGQTWSDTKVLAFLAGQGYQGDAARPFLRPLAPRHVLARMARNAEGHAAARGLTDLSRLLGAARQHLEIYEIRDRDAGETGHA
ncbi:MAG: transglutaminase-like domain-containing protein [Planctomycetota bacterium]